MTDPDHIILKSEMMKQELRRVAELLGKWDEKLIKRGCIMHDTDNLHSESNKIYAFLGRIETD